MIATLEAELGRQLAELRKARGLTQSQLGELLRDFLGGAGWTRQAVWKAEAGERNFTAAELIGLAAALDATVPQLFDFPDAVRMPSGLRMEAATVDALMSGRKLRA